VDEPDALVPDSVVCAELGGISLMTLNRRVTMQDAPINTTLDDTVDETDAAAAGQTADTANSVPVITPARAVTAPPGMKLVDPFAHYAASEGGNFFSGDYVKLDRKDGWVRGQKKTAIDATEAWVADVNEARHGWIVFGESTERHAVLIREHPALPPCPACGGTALEHEHDKLKRCDWRSVVYLLLRSLTDSNDVVCFTGTGKGARKAVAQLCGIYRRPGADRQGKSPVLLLESRSFENESKGTTAWPVFKIVRWEFFAPGEPAPEVQPIAVPIAPPAKPAAPARGRSAMDDEIPF
jgi:hypothetical protein